MGKFLEFIIFLCLKRMFFLHKRFIFFRENFLCWTYFLKKYPDNFLEDRQLISNYGNSVEKPYVKPSDRPRTPKPLDDLDYRS